MVNYYFFEASKRHYDDGELLYNNMRIPNAGQLYGFSAECGIKALLVGLKGGELDEKYWKHVNALYRYLARIMHKNI